MRVVVMYLRKRSFVLRFLRVGAVVLSALFVYSFGSLFAAMSVKVRIGCIASFICLASGYANMYFGTKYRDYRVMLSGYVVTTIGILIFEISTLLLGGMG